MRAARICHTVRAPLRPQSQSSTVNIPVSKAAC